MSVNSREYSLSVVLFMSVASTKCDMLLLGHFMLFDIRMRLQENLNGESECWMADAIYVIKSTQIL